MIQSKSFMNRVLRNPRFSRRVLSMVVDEAHCISHWGADFRKKYASLGVVRAFLPRGTPVIAMTATLTARTRRDICTKLHFSKGCSRYINAGNERANISLVVRACEHPLNSYADLDFVIPPGVKTADEVPKTWIYADNISTGTDIIDHLQRHLHEQNQHLASENIIRPFNAVMSLEYRREAMEAFRRGDIRILVCTDAAGMVRICLRRLYLASNVNSVYQGCDIADIDVVVQWKLPKTFSNWIQRAGRAARGKDRTGLAVLLVEKAAYSVLVGHAEAAAGKGKGKGKKAGKAKKQIAMNAKEYAAQHGIKRGGCRKSDEQPTGVQPKYDPEAADEGLLVFVQSTECRRKVWREVFETPVDIELGV